MVLAGPLLATGALVGPLAPVALAQEVPAAQGEFRIAAQPLGDALVEFGRQSGLEVTADPALIAGKRSAEVSGRFAPGAALSRLLAGTGLTFRYVSATGVTLERAPQASGDGAIRLGPVRVAGAGNAGGSGILPSITSDPGATEGTGSYTARSTNTATGLRMSLKETPQSVTVFTRARIEDQALSEISEVLDQTVGVSANIGSALGTDGTSFYSRGFRVENFQIDGAERPSTIYGFEVTTADMAAYDRIEIVRGATGLLNGVGTPAATINLVRKKPTFDFQAHVYGQAGSWDRYRLEGDVSTPLTADGSVRGRLVAAYHENDWFIDREHLEKQLFYGIVEADVTDRLLLLTVGAEYQKFRNSGGARSGLPFFFTDGRPTDFPRSTNSAAKWGDFYNRSLNLFSSLEYDLGGDWNLKLDAEYSDRKYDDTLGYVNGSNPIDPLTGVGGNFLTARWNGYLEEVYASFRASGPYTLFGREHDLMVGISYSDSRDQNDDFPGWWSGSAYSHPNYNFFDLIDSGEIDKAPLSASGAKFGTIVKHASGYAATRLKPLDGISLILGGRITNWTEQDWNEGATDSTASSGPKTKEKGVFTPYGGLVVDITDSVSAYVSYSKIFNPQTNEDIDGDRLAPLTGANYEGGLKASFFDEKLNASIAVFYIAQDNFALDTGLLNPKGNTAYEAVSGTKSKGFELEVSGEALPGWQVSGGFSHAKVKDRDDAPLETHIPVDTFKFFSSYDFSDTLEGVTIGGNLRWQGRVYREDAFGVWANNDIFEQDGFVLVDLMARYAVSEHLSLTANVNNIFDQKYFSAVGYSGRYGTPRQALVSAKYQF
ncbi:hypothetical protein B2G71_04320 [Novosphingobium sp. PC22D]|nr:hypothetical protein B2G71_04320 [Novosphingobium sp. PC22D]